MGHIYRSCCLNATAKALGLPTMLALPDEVIALPVRLSPKYWIAQAARA